MPTLDHANPMGHAHATALSWLLTLLFVFGVTLSLYEFSQLFLLALGGQMPDGRVLSGYRAAHGGGDVPWLALLLKNVRGVLYAAVALLAVWLRRGNQWAWRPLMGALAIDITLFVTTALLIFSLFPALEPHVRLEMWFAVAAIEMLSLVVLRHEVTSTVLVSEALKHSTSSNEDHDKPHRTP